MQWTVRIGVALLVGSSFLGTVGVGAARASVLGGATIDICKSGPVTGAFWFSLNSAQPIAVQAGTCDPVTVENGYNSVVELADPTGATTLSAITVTPSVDKVTSSVPNRSVTVNIPANSVATVDFTNIPVTRIQVCKVAGDPSLVGKPFSFTEQALGVTSPPFTVTAGAPGAAPSCGGLTAYPAGTPVNVAEASSNGTTVQSIVVAGGTSSNVNLAAGTITATLGSSGTTTVTYTDVAQQQPGSLKVCKVAGDTFVPVGPWSFTITSSGGAVVGTVSVATGNCSAPVAVPPGAYTVTEAFGLPDYVSSITALPTGSLLSSNLATGTAVVSVAAGATTTATFTNDVPLARIQVCKVAGDPSLVGKPFSFTEQALGVTSPPFTVTAGAPGAAPSCGGLTAYPAGTPVNVAEASSNGTTVQSIVVAGGTSSNVNLAAGTITATLGSSGTTTVTYTDVAQQQPGSLKVCKVLVPGSGALAGTAFTFLVTDGAVSQTVSVTAVAPGQTTPCTLVSTGLPVGSVATVTEQPTAGTSLVGVGVTPSSQDAGSTPTTAKVTIAASAASATFTDQAMGWIEICKHGADPSVVGHSFAFSVNGGAPVTVVAGQCSSAIEVPVGTATVDESQTDPSFYLSNVSTVSVTDPGGARLLSGPTTNPAVIAVIAGGIANETVVTFTNASKQGAFKICTGQTSPDAALQGRLFSYGYTYTLNGSVTTGSVTLVTPLWGATCSGIIGPISATNATGQPVTVSVTALLPSFASVDLVGFRYQGAGSATSTPSLPAPFPTTATFSLGAGMNIVTFTNGATH